jgi:zinc/manganese transport system substrate-binding protein
VTTSVLGAVVRDLVGDRATVSVLMGEGVDPHEWSPSAQDIETLHHAELVVANGLGLEAPIDGVLDEVAASGVPVFRATDHVTLRALTDDGHEEDGALDPHFWTDPLSMRDVVLALGPALEAMGVPVSDRQADLVARLEALDAEVRSMLEVVPPERRQLVTGHESMGYFAARYGFQLIGAIIPGLSSQGEVSASQLGAISTLIRDHGVPAIFTEIGTPQAVVDAIAGETGVRVVPLPSHTLPADGSYLTFIRDIATAVAGALG